MGGGGESEGAAVEHVPAALPGDQRVERAERASFSGQDQDVGRGAFADLIEQRFRIAAARYKLDGEKQPVGTTRFKACVL